MLFAIVCMCVCVVFVCVVCVCVCVMWCVCVCVCVCDVVCVCCGVYVCGVCVCVMWCVCVCVCVCGVVCVWCGAYCLLNDSNKVLFSVQPRLLEIVPSIVNVQRIFFNLLNLWTLTAVNFATECCSPNRETFLKQN